MTLIPWPDVLVPASEGWRLAQVSRSGGTSLIGAEQIVTGPLARWAAALTIPIRTDAQVLACRALLAGLDGRAGRVLVGPCDRRRAPWPVDGWGRRVTPRSLRTPSLDRTPYADAPDVGGDLIAARLAASAIRGATTLEVEVTAGSLPKAGNYLGLGTRLYMIVAAVPSPIPGRVICQIRPGLRNAAAGGAPVELVRPVCEMRLASDETGAFDLSLGRFGTVTLDLIEAF